jgi:hypothetical protein
MIMRSPWLVMPLIGVALFVGVALFTISPQLEKSLPEVVNKPCTTCKAKGKVPCLYCKGSGFVESFQLGDLGLYNSPSNPNKPSPSRQKIRNPCNGCKSTGFRPCGTCFAKGFIPTTVPANPSTKP